MKMRLFALLAVLAVAVAVSLSVATAATTDITLTTTDTPPVSTVTKICVSQATFDRKTHIAVLVYESCDGSGNFTGSVARLFVNDAGFRLVHPLGVITTGATPNWLVVTSDFAGVPGMAKALMTHVMPGT